MDESDIGRKRVNSCNHIESHIPQEVLSQVIHDNGGDRIYACFECGQCVSVCPVRRVNSAFSPRKIMHMLFLGLLEGLIQDEALWLCTNCYTCQEICPQGIKVAEIINTLKNISFRRGFSPPGVLKQSGEISGSGMLYRLDEFDMKKRKKAGLPMLSNQIDEVVRLLENKR
jgi:heterodisulfide reductase subunit C